MKCKKCGSTNVTHNADIGKSVCECGNVCEAQTIVNQVDFLNTGTRSKVYGSFFDKNRILSESGQLRLYKAYKLIEQIASKLSLPHNISESAKLLYGIAKLDFDKNFVQGRQTKHVAAVVLYIACRQEKKPLLLIDFADVLQTSLYSLGSTYLKLVKKINNNMEKLDLPLIDPSLFIHKFCAKLEFEDKTQVVATTALRMLQSMKRDWISTGRRPAGLCGAAILISARYHGFKRTTHQIVKVVKVCHETIRKRLQEFKNTSTAALTMEEFEAIEDGVLNENTQGAMDPPAFIKNLLKKNKAVRCIGDVDGQMSIAFKEIQDEIGESEPIEEDKNDEEPLQLVKAKSKDRKINNVITIEPLMKKRSSKLKRKKELADNESDLSDSSDDDEIQHYLLNDQEKVVKSVIWHEMNKEWIQEQKEKDRLKKLVMKTTKKPSTPVQPIVIAKPKEERSNMSYYEAIVKNKIIS